MFKRNLQLMINFFVNQIKHEEKYLLYIILCGVFMVGLLTCFFRITSPDESIYLRETMIISETIRQFKWWGNYATGLHGFLFKVPVALIFLFTGPSIKAATMFTVVLSCITAYLFYYLLLTLFKNRNTALVGTLLLVLSYNFVTSFPTYLREIPVLLSIVLFMYLALKNKPIWMLGLSLLLILDAKEYVFYTFSIALTIWIAIITLKETKNNILRFFSSSIIKGVQLFFPSLLWIFLMFYTPIIPINMFNASILGLVQGNNWSISQFDPNFATKNILGNTSINIPQITEGGLLRNTVILLLAYIAKISYPSTFTFLSIPMFIVVPAIIVGLLSIFQYKKSKNDVILLYGLLMVSYIIIYIIRTSHARYLLPASPMIYVFFLFWLLNKNSLSKRWNLLIFTITAFFVYFGLLFELKSIVIKLIFYTSALYALYGATINKSDAIGNKFKYYFAVLVILVTTGSTSIYSHYIKQIKPAQHHGSEQEVQKVLKYADIKEKLWINDIGWNQDVAFFRKDTYYNPEWNWFLSSSLPKKYMLTTLGKPNTYSAYPTKQELADQSENSGSHLFQSDISGYSENELSTINNFKTYIQKNHINKIIIVKSLTEGLLYPMQNQIEKLSLEPWLKLEHKVTMKNKEVYVFAVSPEVNPIIE